MSDEETKPYQQQIIMQWQQDAYKCPMLDIIRDQKRCLVGGFRMVKPIACTFETCFARFSKHISG